MPSKILTPLLGLVLLLVWSGGYGNAQGEQQTSFATEGVLALPKYPTLPSRAGINGDFEIEIRIEDGAVKSIKVISGWVITGAFGGKKEITHAFDSSFISSIENAVRRWHFNADIKPNIRRMAVRFRTVECEPEEVKPGYYTYRGEGVNDGIWQTPPTRITIEYHHHLELESSQPQRKVN
jgi:hypothetical protein